MSRTTIVTIEDDLAGAGAGGGPRGPGGSDAPSPQHQGTWTLRARGLRTVVELELRQRVRSTRWKAALAVWFVVVGLVTLLAFRATAAVLNPNDVPELDVTHRGPLIFALVVFFVLLAGLLVAPTLSAGAVNGDRNAGTLAILQVTMLSPAEIVLGKLLAGWIAALAFLVASLPFVLVALAAGGVGIGALVTTLLLLVVMLGVVCAIGVGFSALVARTTGSALLTYLAVLGLVFGTLIVFGLTFPLVTSTDDVRVRIESPTSSAACAWTTEQRTQAHTERTWWLLAPNPFVVVADAAPTAPAKDVFTVPDPLRAIRDGVRLAKAGPSTEDWCQEDGDGYAGAYGVSSTPRTTPVWPWGLAFDLVLGAGAVWLAVRRLRIPQRKLPRGTRVA